MKTFISILSAFGFICAITGIIFFIIALSKKILHYPSNIQQKVSKNFYIAGTLIALSMLCFSGGKQIIKLDFKNILQQNKIISLEINGIFFSQDDLKDVFTNFQGTEGRYRCDHFTGYINLENNEIIPIEVIRHCYEKNRYIIISKKYYLDADIGDIITDKFEYVQNNTN